MNVQAWVPLLDALLDAAWLVDAKSLRIVATNQQACELIGMPTQSLMGLPTIELTATPEDMFFWEDVAAGLSDSIHSNTMLRCSAGVAVPVERRVSRVWLSDDEPVYVVTVRDLRPQYQTEDALEDRLAELRATLESTGDGILVTDLTGAVRNFNHHFAILWSVPQSVLDDRDDAALIGRMADAVQDREGYIARLNSLLQEPLKEATDILQLGNGNILERVTLPQISRGRAIGRVYSFRDISQRLEAQKRIETLAYTDALTGLPNRLMLTQRAELALRMANRSGGKSALVFIDLDRFKNIND
jgi:PAS domain S-box-containing protein